MTYYFLCTIHYLSHTYNMAYYYGDLNIAMLKNCKREPLDLSLEVTIIIAHTELLSKLYYKLNVKDLYRIEILL